MLSDKTYMCVKNKENLELYTDGRISNPFIIPEKVLVDMLKTSVPDKSINIEFPYYMVKDHVGDKYIHKLGNISNGDTFDISRITYINIYILGRSYANKLVYGNKILFVDNYDVWFYYNEKEEDCCKIGIDKFCDYVISRYKDRILMDTPVIDEYIKKFIQRIIPETPRELTYEDITKCEKIVNSIGITDTCHVCMAMLPRSTGFSVK